MLAALVVLGAHKLWKIGLESGVWQDEIFSLQVVELSPAGIVAAMRADFHPPLYPLVLKGWLSGLTALGVPSTLAAARGLGLVVWVLFVLGLWIAARRLFGRSVESALLPLVVAGSPHLVQFTSDARSYGFAAVAVTLVGLLLTSDLARAGEEGARSPRRWWRWVVITILGAVAAWSHLLSVPLLLGLALVWGALELALRGPRAAYSRLGPPALAAAALVALLLPWLVPATRQLGAYRAAAPEWMTPATLLQLGRVLWESIPFGRHGVGGGRLVGLFSLMGWALVALLVALSLAAIWSRRDDAAGNGRLAARLAGVGLLAVAWGFVALLWGLQRLDLVRMFYAPRYPCLGAGLVALAIGLWLWGFPRSWQRGLAWTTAALWLAIAVVGHTTAAAAGRAGGVVPFVDLSLAEAGLAQGSVVAAFPATVVDRLPESRKARRIEPLATALCQLETAPPLLAVRLSPWRQLLSPTDLLLDEVLRRGLLAREQRVVGAGHSLDFEARVLSGATDVSRRWCAEGVSPRSWVSTTEGAWISAADLRPEDGWSFLDFDESLRPSRWSQASAARLPRDAFPRQASATTLALLGFAAGPGANAVIEIDGREVARLAGEGPFALCLQLPTSASATPLVSLHSPLWRPDDLYHNGDRRWLGVQLRAAGLLPSPQACDAATAGDR